MKSAAALRTVPMRLLFALCMILAASCAGADEGAQRITPGMSLSLQGQVLDLNAPICAPATGSYSVAYRNSIATGCSVGRSSDDFATLEDTDSTPDTYTMPQSSQTTFTGSISGTTLTTPTNAVIIGSVITGVGVLDNTYVTAGAGTSWTVTNSQTVGSETLTQSVFPPGHGSCFKNNGTSLLTLTATTSTIKGAAGVVNGNPAVTGGQVTLYPGGEACLQAGTDHNYRVSGFLAGSWFQSASTTNPVSSFQWLGLSGYPRLHLSCSSMGSIGTPGQLFLQLAYGGTFQATGYSYQYTFDYIGQTGYGNASNTSDIGFVLTPGPLPINLNHGATLEINLNFAGGTGMGYSNDINGKSRLWAANVTTEAEAEMSGEAPLTTTQAVTGIQIIPVPNTGTIYGMCWLTPKT